MAVSNVPQAMRRQVKEAARMQAAVQAGQDPFAGKQPAAAAPSPPVVPGPTIQPVPEFAVVGADIPAGFVPVDLTRGDPRTAQVQPAGAPTNASPPRVEWTPASQAAQPPAAQPAPQAAQPATTNAPPRGAQPVGDPDPRYKVLQGKYNKEVPELRAQVTELMAQNRALMTMMTTRASAPAPAAPPPVPATARERALAAGFTEKEIDEYGEELVNMVVRTADRVASPQIAALKNENARLASVVQNTVQSVTRGAAERFWDDLAEMVPNYAEINASQEWLDWLQQPDYISGGTRNSGLQNAFNTHDARRVAGIMKQFMAEDARAPTAGTHHVDPATLVAPGQPAASAPAPAGNNGDQEIWTEDQVRQFYTDVRRGRIKGAEKAQVEARINRALVEGRIKPEHNDAYLINSR